MAYYLQKLDPLEYLDLGALLDKYSDWILFTILLMFFVSIVKLALRKRFEESRSFRVLAGSLGFLLAFSMYYSIYKGWLYLNILGFGLFGAFLLISMILIIVYSFLMSYGVHKTRALAIGYALCYISAWYIFPNHAELVAAFFPPLNGLLLILFFISIYKAVSSFFQGKSLISAAKDLNANARFSTADDAEVEKEILDDKKEIRHLKRDTLKLTKNEINTINDIDNLLKQMYDLIKGKGNSISQQEVAEITNILRAITKKEDVLKNGLHIMAKHVNAYKTIHKRSIPELQKRLNRAFDKEIKSKIEREMLYQRRMLEVLDFMRKYEHRIVNFTQAFNQLLFTALERIKNSHPYDSIPYLKKAHNNLQEMKHIYEKQLKFEKYLIKTGKKTVHGLKKEQSLAKTE
jgi:hypothetical protein